MSQDTIPKHFQDRIREAREQQLEKLDLRDGELNQIPDSVFKLTHLKVLNLSWNKIHKIPDSFPELYNLNELYLSGNKISYLPDFFSALPKLNKLDLSYNKITDLPNSFSQLSNLKKLYLVANQISNLPDSFFQLSSLKRLYLSDNQISNLPDSFSQLFSLTELYLSRNEISNLPIAIANLSELTELELSKNQISNLPICISNLSKLSKLYLSNNQISHLPDFFCNLYNLTELDLSGNQINNLPNSFFQLSNLTKLYLNKNKLFIIPTLISKLSNLTKLDLSYNQISALPTSITELSNLTKLDLSYNQISALPASIIKFSDLTELYLSDNPLEIPPIEVVNQGMKSIKEYFRQIREKGKDYIYEAKLLIVGEGDAGKTTLAKKIENSNYQLDSNEKSTEGIDITKWSFTFLDKEKKEQEFKVNIWDFGGQEIYHATHQFFLTKRSLYALVAETRKEDTDFYYWLNVVELLSNNSPLIIIKNEKGDRKKEINERALRKQFKNLQNTLVTNLATNRGLEEILTDIKHYIGKLPHIGQALPKTWVKVKESLKKDSRNYIYLQEYLDICEANGFSRLEDKLQLSGYLHDLGVCLHFQEEEDSLLYKTVILKPEWGTDAVYKVLDNSQVIEHQGCFTRNDLKKIWHEEKYSSMRGELLELMKKFQLCYEIPDTKDTFIAPQLLSDNQADYDWDESDNIILRYAYPDFMPKGIISRFIVVMHQYIEQQKYVWKSGVILYKDNTKAEVIEDYGKREIRIRVAGKLTRKLMTEVTYELDKINDSFHELNYQKLIPCNCEACKNSQNPYTYQFKELIERLAHKKLTIDCRKPPYHEVQVFSLIDNAVDIKQLISQDNQDSNKSFEFKGNIKQLIIQYLEKGDFMEGDRKIQGDYVEGNKTDSSRNLDISGKAQVNASGAGAFSQGDISGTVANTINQLPNFESQPDKKELKELLTQLQTAVLEAELDEEEKEESLEQIKAIASSLTNSQDGTMKKAAKRAMRVLQGIGTALPQGAAMVTICNQLPDLISKIF